jgi:hypothetical protein
MISFNEYGIGLCFLFAAAFGAFSKLLHWIPKSGSGKSTKVPGAVAIVIGFVLAVLVTIANKGEKPWSPMLDLIDTRMAERVPLPPDPALRFYRDSWPYTRIALLPGIKIARTSQGYWQQLGIEIREQRIKLPALPVPKPESETAALEFTLETPRVEHDPDAAPVREGYFPPVGGVYSVAILYRDVSKVDAKNGQILIRICEHCTYAEEPKGSNAPDGDFLSKDRRIPFSIAYSTAFMELPPIKIRLAGNFSYMLIGCITFVRLVEQVLHLRRSNKQ